MINKEEGICCGFPIFIPVAICAFFIRIKEMGKVCTILYKYNILPKKMEFKGYISYDEYTPILDLRMLVGGASVNNTAVGVFYFFSKSYD